MKSSFYFKHDLDARGDDKMRALLMKKGATGYGIYWMLAEDLYKNGGRIARDYAALSWDYRQPEKEIKSVVEDFGLFYDVNGKIACRRVDRGVAELEECRAQAREAGRRGGLKAAAKRALEGRSSDPTAVVKQGEDRKGEEGKDITAAPSAADLKRELSTAVDKLCITLEPDLEDVRLPFDHGDVQKGRRIMDMSAEDCKSVLAKHPRIGFQIVRALRHRIKIKTDEMNTRPA